MQHLRERFAVPVEKLGRLLIIEDAWMAAVRRGHCPCTAAPLSSGSADPMRDVVLRRACQGELKTRSGSVREGRWRVMYSSTAGFAAVARRTAQYGDTVDGIGG